MDHFLEPYGRPNSLVSPEERWANKESTKRKWEEEKEEKEGEASFMSWELSGFVFF